MYARIAASPWLTIWTHPRATIREVLSSKSGYLAIAIVALGSFNAALADMRIPDGIQDHTSIPASIVMNLFVGALFALLLFYIQSALIKSTGSWIGGEASYEDIQTAVAWSRVPLVWALLLWVPKIAIFKERAFPQGSMPKAYIRGVGTFFNPIHSSPDEALLFKVLTFLLAIIGIWAFIILLNCLAEVQGFSTGMAFYNVILAFAIIIVPLAIALLASSVFFMAVRPV